MKGLITQIFSGFLSFLRELGEITHFLLRAIRESLYPPYEFRELLRQAYLIGYKSLPLVGSTAFIMGLVLTIQSRPTLVEFGAESWLPSMVAVSIVREIGPVITALICAGRIGSTIGAELGSMKVTEQIDAMEVSGTNPFKYLVATRVLASTFMIPVLVVIADAISLFGSFVAVNINGRTTATLFYSNVFETLMFADLFPSLIKCFFFGAAIGIIGCYYGWQTTKGTEGVGRSANTSVVYSSMAIFVLDLAAVQITEFLQLYN